MTATSISSPTALTRSWSAVQRTVALVFVIAVFAAVAFTVGRASAHTGHGSPVIAPSSISAPSPSGATPQCRVGHPC